MFGEVMDHPRPSAAVQVVVAALLLAAIVWLRASFMWQASLPEPLFFFVLYLARVPQFVWPFFAGVLFLAWAPELLNGSPRVPLRSRAGLAFLSLLSVLNIWAGWEYAASYRGWLAVCGIVAATVLPLAALCVLLSMSVRQPSFERSLLLHWGVLAWLITLGFPVLGELP